MKVIVRKSTAAAVALALAVTVAVMGPGQAEATAVVGATEPTQILNHVELLAQYEKQLDQAITQANTYLAMAQQLKSLPDTAKNSIQGVGRGFQGVNGADIASAQQMLGALRSSQYSVDILKNEGLRAYDTLQSMQAAGHGITPVQYEAGMAKLAEDHADTYGVRLTTYEGAIANQKAAMSKIDDLYKSSDNISSNVGGLQAVVRSNAVLAQQLSNIQSSLDASNITQLQSAQDAAMAISAQRQQRASKACEGAMFARVLGVDTHSGKSITEVCPELDSTAPDAQP